MINIKTGPHCYTYLRLKANQTLSQETVQLPDVQSVHEKIDVLLQSVPPPLVEIHKAQRMPDPEHASGRQRRHSRQHLFQVGLGSDKLVELQEVVVPLPVHGVRTIPRHLDRVIRNASDLLLFVDLRPRLVVRLRHPFLEHRQVLVLEALELPDANDLGGAPPLLPRRRLLAEPVQAPQRDVLGGGLGRPRPRHDAHRGEAPRVEHDGHLEDVHVHPPARGRLLQVIVRSPDDLRGALRLGQQGLRVLVAVVAPDQLHGLSQPVLPLRVDLHTGFYLLHCGLEIESAVSRSAVLRAIRDVHLEDCGPPYS
mmetsp:Transcript_101293/g.275306  ORF Transcript_101293/g.275306 Transcript_101293/m.275306 type:complete len:310 (+) Transcript_101293:211-1140(+)